MFGFTMISIAAISTKGGTGKTAVSVCLACWWAAEGHHVYLIDTDSQDTESATWWLDHTDDALQTLSWVETTTNGLARKIPSIDADYVIVDTPPRIDDKGLLAVAQAVDLVLIPGSTLETPSMIQTAKTITQASSTPLASVYTREATTTMDSRTAFDGRAQLASIGAPVIGRIRRYAAMNAAPIHGKRPDQIELHAREQLGHDIKQLANNIIRKIR